jgi:hypothetical protein
MWEAGRRKRCDDPQVRRTAYTLTPIKTYARIGRCTLVLSDGRGTIIPPAPTFSIPGIPSPRDAFVVEKRVIQARSHTKHEHS